MARRPMTQRIVEISLVVCTSLPCGLREFPDDNICGYCGTARLVQKCRQCNDTGWVNVGLGFDSDPRDAVRCQCPKGTP